MKISASRITTYADCSLKYRFQYIDKLDKMKESVHLIYGSAIHEGLESLNISLKNNNSFEIEDVLQSFHNSWNNELVLHKLENDFFVPKLYTMGINTLIKFCNEMSDYEVLGTEFEFEVPIKTISGNEYTLYGLIDAIIKVKDQMLIVDYKTSKEPYKKFKLDTSIQLSIYSYAIRYLLDNKIINFNTKKKKEDYIAYYILLKDYDTLSGDIKIQKKSITDKHKNRMFYIINQFINGIENNIFIPNYNSQCEWCEYKKECLEFDGTK